MKTILLSKSVVLIAFLLSCSSFAQTNVSGGIYTNATWTKAKSPYIVTDTIVVFPGVTLTIEPGVTVKFADNKRLEIRQAKLIAIGTSTDSITFTSNSGSPMSGIWASIWLNGGTLQSQFNYCNFRYANRGIQNNQSATLFFKNSIFKNNIIGLYGQNMLVDSCNFISNNDGIFENAGLGIIGNSSITNCKFSHNKSGIHIEGIGLHPSSYIFINNCILDSNQTAIMGLYYTTIDNCMITHNQYGIIDDGSNLMGGFSTIKNCTIDSNSMMGLDLIGTDSVIYCQIKYNGIGVSDSNYFGGINIIAYNVIENNKIGIKFEEYREHVYCNKICNNASYDFYNASSSAASISNNYWCTTDSAAIASHIYDGYDNISLGLVSFLPLDTQQCYLITGIAVNAIQNFSFTLYPNPASDYLTVQLPTTISKAEVKIFNLLGELELSYMIAGNKANIDVSALARGMYILEIVTENTISRQKLIKQ